MTRIASFWRRCRYLRAIWRGAQGMESPHLVSNLNLNSNSNSNLNSNSNSNSIPIDLNVILIWYWIPILSRLPGCYFGCWVLDVEVHLILIPCSCRGLSIKKGERLSRKSVESVVHGRLLFNLSIARLCANVGLESVLIFRLCSVAPAVDWTADCSTLLLFR